jgi:hypothetical protein
VPDCYNHPKVHNLAGTYGYPMTRNWLASRFGINSVAFGIVAALIVVVVIVWRDVLFLITGAWPKLSWYREVLYHLLAAVAALFFGVSFFFFRPGLPRFVAVVVAISFASYVVQPFAAIPSQPLTALCVARIVGFCTLLMLLRVYFVDLRAGRVAR